MMVLDHVLACLRAGVSVFPVRRDGSKAPESRFLPLVFDPKQGKEVASWNPYREALMSEAEARRIWDRPEPPGYAIVGGAISGGMEMLDLDNEAELIYPQWAMLVEEQAPGLVDRLPVVRTPRSPAGFHVFGRHPDIDVPGHMKLAEDPSRPAKERTLIETRGEGGYVVGCGSPVECHETGRTWEHIAGPPPWEAPALSIEERDILLLCARYFDRSVAKEAKTTGHHTRNGELKPGTDFDMRGPDWSDILTPHGWELAGQYGGERRWRRPGKARGWSATTGHCHGREGEDLLRVFSSSTDFEVGAYGKFRAYAVLEHGGDLSAAAKDLGYKGYGGQHRAKQRAESRSPEPESELHIPSPSPWPSPPGEEAYLGLAGKVVQAIEPHTEADPMALLVQFLAFFGNAAGRGSYAAVSGRRHHPNLFAVLVGNTAKGRKGTSLHYIESLFRLADPRWSDLSVTCGLSSGEGLINAVRDRKTKLNEEGEEVVVDEGAEDADKRILVIEEEFAQPLRMAGRDGNILSTVLRQAWDSGRLRTLTRANPLRATGAHISVIGHITRQELFRCLTRTDQANGFANRFLWLAVQRSKLLPDGGGEPALASLAGWLRSALSLARQEQAIQRTEAATDLWREIYPGLTAERPGIYGLVTSRAEAQILRLSLVYALLDECSQVDEQHIRAAMAVWDYCERSCCWVFGEGTGDDTADEILQALRGSPQGLTLTQISGLFHRNRSTQAIGHALGTLRDQGLAREEKRPNASGHGRKVTVWSCCVLNEENGRNETSYAATT